MVAIQSNFHSISSNFIRLVRSVCRLFLINFGCYKFALQRLLSRPRFKREDYQNLNILFRSINFISPLYHRRYSEETKFTKLRKKRSKLVLQMIDFCADLPSFPSKFLFFATLHYLNHIQIFTQPPIDNTQFQSIEQSNAASEMSQSMTYSSSDLFIFDVWDSTQTHSEVKIYPSPKRV